VALGQAFVYIEACFTSGTFFKIKEHFQLI